MEITTGKEFESDAVYYCDKPVYDIYPDDCIDAEVVTYSHKKVHKTAFYIENKSNITLDFCGATVILHGYIEPFVIKNCKNVTIKNVTVGYSRPAVNEMKVVSKTDDSFTCKMGDAYAYKVEDGNLTVLGDGWQNDSFCRAPGFMQSFDGGTREAKGIYLGAFGKNVEIDKSLPWADDTYIFKLSEQDGLLRFESSQTQGHGGMPAYEVGDIVAFSFSGRDLSHAFIERSKDISIENYRILSGQGMGLVPIHCENIKIDGLKLIYDEKSTGIIANDADCIHAISCSGDFIIKNSVLKGYLDDAINIHSYFYTFVSGEGNKITALCEGVGTEFVRSFDAGDTIRLYRGHSMESVCDYKILKADKGSGKEWIFTVDKAVETHEKGDLIENMSAQCNIEIADCKFAKSNTNIRIQTRGKVTVHDCKIDLPILFTGDTNFWFESSPCESAVIKNCEFGRKSAKIKVVPEFTPTEKEPYYHKSVTVENCRFKGEEAVEASYLEKLTFSGNTTFEGGKPSCVLNRCGEAVNDCGVITRIDKPTNVKY